MRDDASPSTSPSHVVANSADISDIDTLEGARSIQTVLQLARARLQGRVQAGIARKDYAIALACIKALDAASELIASRINSPINPHLVADDKSALSATVYPFPTPLPPHFNTITGGTSCPNTVLP